MFAKRRDTVQIFLIVPDVVCEEVNVISGIDMCKPYWGP